MHVHACPQVGPVLLSNLGGVRLPSAHVQKKRHILRGVQLVSPLPGFQVSSRFLYGLCARADFFGGFCTVSVRAQTSLAFFFVRSLRALILLCVSERKLMLVLAGFAVASVCLYFGVQLVLKP